MSWVPQRARTRVAEPSLQVAQRAHAELREQLASDREAVTTLVAADASLIAAEYGQTDIETHLRAWRASRFPSPASAAMGTPWLETGAPAAPSLHRTSATVDQGAVDALRLRREALAHEIAGAQARVLGTEAKLPHAAYEVLRERLTGLAAEYESKRAAFEAAHARVFATARAIDMLARRVQGEGVDGGSHSQLCLPRPRHPGFGGSRGTSIATEIERQARQLIDRLTGC